MSAPDSYGNALRDQTSPYLVQHADNPVAWQPWGAEALERALFAACFAQDDREEGVSAFRERREPEFPSAADDRESRGSE